METTEVQPVEEGAEFPQITPEPSQTDSSPVPADEPPVPAETDAPSTDGSIYLVFEGQNSQESVKALGSLRATSPEAAIEMFAEQNQTPEGTYLRAMAARNWPADSKARAVAYERRVVLK